MSDQILVETGFQEKWREYLQKDLKQLRPKHWYFKSYIRILIPLYDIDIMMSIEWRKGISVKRQYGDFCDKTDDDNKS